MSTGDQKILRYFAIDCEGEMSYFETPGEAKAKAEEFITFCGDAEGGWIEPEEVIETICWGSFAQVALLSSPKPDEWIVKLEDVMYVEVISPELMRRIDAMTAEQRKLFGKAVREAVDRSDGTSTSPSPRDPVMTKPENEDTSDAATTRRIVFSLAFVFSVLALVITYFGSQS